MIIIEKSFRILLQHFKRLDAIYIERKRKSIVVFIFWIKRSTILNEKSMRNVQRICIIFNDHAM